MPHQISDYNLINPAIEEGSLDSSSKQKFLSGQLPDNIDNMQVQNQTEEILSRIVVNRQSES